MTEKKQKKESREKLLELLSGSYRDFKCTMSLEIIQESKRTFTIQIYNTTDINNYSVGLIGELKVKVID